MLISKKFIRNLINRVKMELTKPDRKLLIILLVGISFLLLSESLFARAGGGGGFGGGDDGGSGGDGGLGALIFFLIYFAIQYPLIGIPLIIVVAIVLYFGQKSAKSGHVTRTIRNGYSNQKDRVFRDSVNYLKEKDPNFSELPLIDRAKKTFMKVQDAWSNQDMSSVRPLVSDGIYERFSLQTKIQKDSLTKNIVKNINIINTNLVSVESDHFFDTVHIMITASSIDYYERIDNGKQLSGNIMQAEPFTEYWSFLRRPGAKSLTDKGLIEGFCPNCGTPLELSDSTVCPSCKAVVNSGEYDWVLAEITQASEWKHKSSKSIVGMDEMCQKDPAFNVQHIEDKTSVIFYRNIASQFYANNKYISKLANDKYVKEHKADYTALPNGKHEFFADAAVGSVEVVEIITAENKSLMDSVRVKVKWAGHKVQAKIPSLISPDFGASHIYTQEYILERKESVLSSVKNILTSTHCPGCGSPESLDSSGHCSYCGIALNDGSWDWVLTEIKTFAGYPQHESQYQAFQQAPPFTSGPVLSKYDNESVISCAVAVMLSDGEIDSKEHTLLEQLSQSKGITSQKLAMIIKTVQEKGLHIPKPESKEASQEFLRCMVLMCLADGKVTPAEKVMIKNLASKMGYTDIDINLMIKRERNTLYSNAKSINKS